VLFKERSHKLAVSDILAHLNKAGFIRQPHQAGLLQIHIVVVIQVIDTDDLIAAVQQALRKMETNKTGTTGDQNFQRTFSLKHHAGANKRAINFYIEAVVTVFVVHRYLAIASAQLQ
jgi:hypothetical protein